MSCHSTSRARSLQGLDRHRRMAFRWGGTLLYRSPSLNQTPGSPKGELRSYQQKVVLDAQRDQPHEVSVAQVRKVARFFLTSDQHAQSLGGIANGHIAVGKPSKPLLKEVVCA